MTNNFTALNKHIILTEFDDGAGVLIDVLHKRYYQLNETALLIWRGLEQGLSLAQIVQQITAAYDVSEAEIAAHAAQLLHELNIRQLAIN